MRSIRPTRSTLFRCRHLRLLPALAIPLFLMTMLATLPAHRAAAQDTVAATRQYNQACRLSLAGNLESALEAFGQALDMGFDHLHHAEHDPDLAALRQTPGFQRLLAGRRAELHLLASERGVDLASGQWCDPIALTAGLAGETPPLLRLRWQPEGLDFELELPGPWALAPDTSSPAPWNGGFGLILTLAVPDEGAAYESRGNFVLAFGLEKSTPVGAFYVPQAGWQRVLELDPQLQMGTAGESTLMSGTVPWQAIQPFHPLADEHLGINAAVRVPSGAEFTEAELFPDPDAFRPGGPIRRFVPLNFNLDTVVEAGLVGRIPTSVVSTVPLDLILTVATPEAGTGILAVDVTDNKGNSVIAGGAQGGSVKLAAGPNRLQRQADFSGLEPGLFTIRAEVLLPSDQEAVWTTRVLHLGPDWQVAAEQRIATLAGDEQPTARYYLDTIAAALNTLFPRSDPGAIATTLGDLDRILTRAQQTGTILPDQGAMLVVLPDDLAPDQLCTLYLPAGWRERGPVNPVLVLAGMPGFEPRLVQRLSRWYEVEGQLEPSSRTTSLSPVYLIPHAPGGNLAPLNDQVAAAAAVLQWATTHFGMDRTSICAVDAAAGAGLTLATQRPDQVRALQIMAGGRMEPWPQARSEFLAGQLQPVPADLPVTWLDFFQETAENGQGPLILQVMQDLGWQIGPVEKVRGGVSFSQVADRVVLWAEAIP